MQKTKKFSQFLGPDTIQSTDIVVGLRGGQNWQFTGINSGGGGGSVTVVINQTNHGLAVKDWVRIDVLGDYVKAISTTAQNAEVVGMVVDVASADEFTLQVVGYVDTGVLTGLTPGGVYFLSDTNLGEMSLNEPTITGYVSLPVFIAQSATTGYIRQSRGVIIGGFPPLGSSNDGAPIVHTVTQPGNTFAVGDWVRINGVGTYALADGTSFTNALAIGVVIDVNGDDFTIQQAGWSSAVVTMDDNGDPLTASIPYYLSASVAGAITATPPSTVGQGIRPVFISEDPGDQSGWIFPLFPDEITSPSDNTTVIPVNQVAHGFIVGDVVRVSASNTYAKAQADSATNALPVGFVIEVVDADNFVLQTAGFSDAFIAPFTPLVPAQRYFLSPTTLGGITNIEPSTAGQYSVPMLIALNSTTGYILEQRPIAVTSGGSIVQVQSTLQRAVVSFVSPGFSWMTIPSFSVTITPSSVTSKVLLQAMFKISCGTPFTSELISVRIIRDGVYIPNSTGSTAIINPGVQCTTWGDFTSPDDAMPAHILFVDEPASTSPLTYEFQVIGGGAGQLYRLGSNKTGGPFWSAISTIVAQEIG